jgi:hypothetical protein
MGIVASLTQRHARKPFTGYTSRAGRAIGGPPAWPSLSCLNSACTGGTSDSRPRFRYRPCSGVCRWVLLARMPGTLCSVALKPGVLDAENFWKPRTRCGHKCETSGAGLDAFACLGSRRSRRRSRPNSQDSPRPHRRPRKAKSIHLSES